MRHFPATLAAAALLALGLAGCNDPVFQAQADVRVSDFAVTYTGSTVKKANVSGTVVNRGDNDAHNVAVTAVIGANQATAAVDPATLAPGQSGTFSIQLTGSTSPHFVVGWN